MNPQRVYCVIVNWNQKQDTLACLKTVSALDHHLEGIIVVDNASTDGSQAAIATAFPRVRLLKQSQNTGGATGRNIGIRHALDAGAELILVLDNDAEVPPRLMNDLLPLFETEPVGVAGTTVAYYNEPNTVWQAGGWIDRRTGEPHEFHCGEPVSAVGVDTRDIDWIPGCVMLATRTAFETVGLMDDDFFIYYDDIDWCLRVWRKGLRVVLQPRTVVLHKVSRSLGGHESPAKRYYIARNRLRFARRHAAPDHRIRAVLHGTVDELKHACSDAASGRTSSALARCAGMLDFYRGRFGPRLRS